MNMTANTLQARIEAPAALYGGIAPRQGSNQPPRPMPTEAEKQPKTEDVAEPQASRANGTAWQGDERGLRWAIDTSANGRETKTTRAIMDAIDAHTLQAARAKNGTKPQIEVNRDRIAALLGLFDEWKRPDEIYADEAWEICIIWRSGYGRVEIGTEEDGSVGYYVNRTLSEESREGTLQDLNGNELSRVMSWLDKVPEGA